MTSEYLSGGGCRCVPKALWVLLPNITIYRGKIWCQASAELWAQRIQSPSTTGLLCDFNLAISFLCPYAPSHKKSIAIQKHNR